MRRRSTILILLLSVSATAQVNRTFNREIILQRIENGRVTQEHVRRSQFVYSDRGKLIEKVIYKTPSLKGVSDRVVRDFASGKPIQTYPGIQMLAKDGNFRDFGSSVEVKDVWGAHWPTGSRVNVYFSSAFNSDLPVLIQAMEAWNSLIPEVQFIYAGVAETTQVCEACLTVAINPNLKDWGTFQSAENSEGLIIYGRIELRRMDYKTMFSVFAHDLGHTLGLDHSNEGLMRAKLPKGKMVFPTQVEASLVSQRLARH